MQIELKRAGRTALVETMGGELVSYRDEGGVEYIWCGDENYWSGRNPLLFPVVGKPKDLKIKVGGVSYPMTQHGFARRMEFSLAEQGENWCVLELRSDAETLAQYPFPFLLRVRQELLDGGFITTLSVTNPGDGVLPFCIGAHTAFNCPLREGERYEDYILKFDEKETAANQLVMAPGYMSGKTEPCLENADALVPDHAIFDRLDTIILEGLRSHGVSLVHARNGHGVHVDFSGFPMLAFWSMPNKNAPYLCIEPWQGCAHAPDESGELGEKRHCVHLAPGETWSISYTVTTR